MTKAEMIKFMIDCGCYAPVVSEYRAKGYTPDGAIWKTVDYYTKHMTKKEIKEIYDDFVDAHTTWW